MSLRDRELLLELYNSTSGPNWKNSTNWGSVKQLSEWHGVIINNSGHVVGLHLQENGLVGKH